MCENAEQKNGTLTVDKTDSTLYTLKTIKHPMGEGREKLCANENENDDVDCSTFLLCRHRNEISLKFDVINWGGSRTRGERGDRGREIQFSLVRANLSLFT